jgi:hypothetical protein
MQLQFRITRYQSRISSVPKSNNKSGMGVFFLPVLGVTVVVPNKSKYKI